MLTTTISELFATGVADFTMYCLTDIAVEGLWSIAMKFCVIRTNRFCHLGKNPLDLFCIQPSQ